MDMLDAYIELSEKELQKMVADEMCRRIADKMMSDLKDEFYTTTNYIFKREIRKFVTDVVYTQDKERIIERIIKQAVPEVERKAVKKLIDKDWSKADEQTD